MSVRVLLPNAFQKHTNGTREIRSSAGNLPQLITEIETNFPALRSHLRDEQGRVRRFINFYVNEEDIRFLGNDQYSFKDGDEVLVIPSIAGGAFVDGCCAQGCCAQGDSPSAFPRERSGVCSCCSYCGQENCICGD
jgi:sulfur-carrier protein